MKVIYNVGIDIPSEDCTYVKLDSLTSLAEADIVIFCPDIEMTNLYVEANTRTKNSVYIISEENSKKYFNYINHWRSEFAHFLKSGGNIFIILNEIVEYYVYSQTEYSNVILRTNYSFLPIVENFIYEPIEGKTVVPVSNKLIEFCELFKDLMSYKVYFKDYDIKRAVLLTKNKDRAVGVISEEYNGKIFQLPFIDFTGKLTDKDDFSWKPGAFDRGNKFVEKIIQLDGLLRNEVEVIKPPEWVNQSEFRINAAESIKISIENNRNTIQDLENKIVNLETALVEQEEQKILLFGTGKPLENAVTNALKLLGFSAENFANDNLELDQVIVSPEGYRYIGECEGKDNKDIDISKLRQLLDSLNEDFAREEIQEKGFGLLIGNPQRLLPPDERKLDFTLKCKNAAIREKIGLIRTVDIFYVCRYIRESSDEEFKKDCRMAIHNGLGGIIKFPAIPTSN